MAQTNTEHRKLADDFGKGLDKALHGRRIARAIGDEDSIRLEFPDPLWSHCRADSSHFTAQIREMSVDVPLSTTVDGEDPQRAVGFPRPLMAREAHGPPVAKGLSPRGLIRAGRCFRQIATTHLGTLNGHLDQLGVRDRFIDTNDASHGT